METCMEHKKDKFKFMKKTIESIPFAEKGKQVDYWDSELKGFGCRVSEKTKTYIVMSRVNGKLTRISLGKHGVITPDKAREDAIKALGKLNDGVNVNNEKKKAKDRGMTLQQAYDKYLLAKPDMKNTTKVVDKSLLKCHFSDWLNKPLRDITEDMVAKRHKKISEGGTRKNNANNAMRLFRRLYNHVAIKDRELPPNPVQRMIATGQWFKERRRQTVLKEHELPVWYNALQKLDNPIIADYLLLLLLTGLRKNEAISLSWNNVDMKDKSFTIPDTKNDKPHTLPMSDMIVEIFERRLAQRENGFVFPGTGKVGHLIEPKKQVAAIERLTCLANNNLTSEDELETLNAKTPDKVVPGITFCLHDLRRTFASIAEGVVSYSALKRLMNHSDKDVTQGYIVLGVGKLRQPMQQVTDTIRTAMGAPRPETQEEAGQESSGVDQQK